MRAHPKTDIALSFAFFLFFPIAIFSSKALIVLLLALSVICVFSPYFSFSWEGLKNPFYLSLISFLIYVPFHFLSTKDLSMASKEYGKFIMLSLSTYILFTSLGTKKGSECYPRYLKYLLLGGYLAIFFWGLNLIFDFKIINFFLTKPFKLLTISRGVSIIALLIFPMTLYLIKSQNRFIGFLWFTMLLTVLYLSQKHTAFLSVFITLFFLIFLAIFKDYFIRFMQIFIVIFILFTPIFFQAGSSTLIEKFDENPQSIYFASLIHRFHIWEFAAEKITEKPLQGYGINTSAEIKDEEGFTIKFIKPNSKEVTAVFMHDYALHPHNCYLEIWLEYGFIAALITAIFTFYLFERGLRLSSLSEKLVYMGFLTPALIIANISYGIWQGWWLSSLILVALLTEFMIKETKRLT